MIELKKDWEILLANRFCGSADFCIAEEIDPDVWSDACEDCPVHSLCNTCPQDVKNLLETIIEKGSVLNER